MDHHKNSLPIKPQSAYVATSDGSLPIEYQKVLDPLDVLEYVAANTTKISLGTLDVLCAC
jgi:alkanesulfonate monooxygenase SsuD/methylene tetrahydromethanopterin reductase-like flavin-dependent oxidoreductase (luciferase family)